MIDLSNQNAPSSESVEDLKAKLVDAQAEIERHLRDKERVVGLHREQVDAHLGTTANLHQELAQSKKKNAELAALLKSEAVDKQLHIQDIERQIESLSIDVDFSHQQLFSLQALQQELEATINDLRGRYWSSTGATQH